MAFRFSLAAVLRLRQIHEEREERLLTQILAQITQTRENIVTIDRQIVGAKALREQALRGCMTAAELNMTYGVDAMLKEKRQFNLEQLARFEQLRDKQIKTYQAAHRDREVLTSIREKQSAAFAVEQARQEQNGLDDLFISRMPRH